MNLAVYAVGRLKAGPEEAILDRYWSLAKAAGPQIGLTVPPIREFPESRHQQAVARKNAEGNTLLAAIQAGAFLVALDESGRNLSSTDLAQAIRHRRDEGYPEFAFVIGGPDGHGNQITNKAGLVLSMGQMTWPHRLARIMIVEQIYRAITILSGHPYHRR